MASPEHLSTPQRILRTSQLNRIALLPDGRPIPPPPAFMPPPPPSLGRKRQRGGIVSIKPAASSSFHQPPPAAGDPDANYIAYPSDSEDEPHDAPPRLPDFEIVSDDLDEFEGVETSRISKPDSDGDFDMESDADFSEDQEPRRKRAKADDDVEYFEQDEDEEEEEDEEEDGGDDSNGGSGGEEDPDDMNDTSLKKGAKSKRRTSQNWRQDVYKPSASDYSDDSDLNLNEVTPRKKRGKRKSIGGGGKNISGPTESRKPTGAANGLARSKSKSTPNLRPDAAPSEAQAIRQSRFYEGSMNDRSTRPGGVPPFKNFVPAVDKDGKSNMPTYNDFGMLESSASMPPPPPRPTLKGAQPPQSTPPPPKSKFTFFAPISNWFSKRWQKATQEYEERERKKEQEVEVQRQVRLIMERKAKAEKLYAENKLKGINQPTLVNPRVAQEPLVTEDQLVQPGEPLLPIGVAFTTDDIYTARAMNESTASVATIRPVVPSPQGAAVPRSSSDTGGSGAKFSDLARSSVLSATGLYDYREADVRDGTPLTTDTTEPDVEGLRSTSRSPVPVPSKPLTKAEQKKKERLEKKMEDLKRKLAEAELDLSSVMGVDPSVSSASLASPTSQTAPPAAAKKTVGIVDDAIVIHEDGEAEDDEAEKIVESVMGEPEAIASVRARSRSKSPFKKLFNIGGGAASKKSKDATADSALHNVNESAKIKKASPASVRGRAGGRGGRGGKVISKQQRRNTSEDPI
ncbi:hypothetical protein TWF696_003410 [Orbilia brochopaga]|uniref:Uncharacterized protein n=1 Tax=Orbilia brochopaga TaxID=3140254 RepID=A0AAV9TXR9_9PEZI